MIERRRMLLTVSTVLVSSVLVWFNYSAVLPRIVADWGLTGFRAGVIFGVFQAGYLLAVIPMGMLSDRRPPHQIVAIGATGTGLSSLAFAVLATGFWDGSALRFVAGAFMAGVYIPGMRFVSDWYPTSDRGRAIGVFVGAFAFSSGLSFLVSSSVAAAFDWRAAIGVTSVGAILAGPFLLGVAHDGPNRGTTVSTDASFDLSVVRNRAYLSTVGAYTSHSWELYGVRNWLLAFLVSTPVLAASESATLAGILVGAVMAVGGLGNVAGGWLSDHIGRPQAIGLALSLSATITAGLGFVGWIPFPLLVALLLVYGIALTADSAPASTAVTEIVEEERIGTALSIQSVAGTAGTVVSPIVFGFALDASGFPLAFLTLAAGAVVGVLFTASLARQR